MALSDAQVKKIRDDLKSAKIKVEVLKASANDFTIEVANHQDGSTSLRISPGRCDIQVIVDRYRHQAVIWADEPRRSRVEIVSIYKSGRSTNTKDLAEKGRSFPIGMPHRTKYEVVETLKTRSGYDNITEYDHYRVKATTGATRMTLLAGVDEEDHFVCALRKRVGTVLEAHRELRPAGVPANAPRQGEWFFVPPTAEEKAKIEELVASRKKNLIIPRFMDGITRQDYGGYWSPSGNTHMAPISLKVGRKLFVCGYVFDDRGRGQRSRHDPLWLYDWHRVVRNNEMQAPRGVNPDRWD